MAELARQIRFGCSLQLPPVRLAASAVEHLEAGDVLRLDVGASTLPEWRAAGQPLSVAQAMRHGERRAARIERSVAGGER
jgi:flagellar motor switch protein FliM